MRRASETSVDYTRMAESVAAQVLKLMNDRESELARRIETLIEHRDEIDPRARANLASVLSGLIGRTRSKALRILLDE